MLLFLKIMLYRLLALKHKPTNSLSTAFSNTQYLTNKIVFAEV